MFPDVGTEIDREHRPPACEILTQLHGRSQKHKEANAETCSDPLALCHAQHGKRSNLKNKE